MSYSALNCVDMDGLNAPFPTHTNTNPIKNAHSLAMAPYPTAMITAPNTALLCAPKRASDTIPPNTGVRYAKHANVPYALALVASAASNRARIAVAPVVAVVIAPACGGGRPRSGRQASARDDAARASETQPRGKTRFASSFPPLRVTRLPAPRASPRGEGDG